MGFASTGLGLQIKSTMSRAVGQALKSFFIGFTAIQALPPLLAETRSLYAETMTRAGRMWTVNYRKKSFSHPESFRKQLEMLVFK